MKKRFSKINSRLTAKRYFLDCGGKCRRCTGESQKVRNSCKILVIVSVI